MCQFSILFTFIVDVTQYVTKQNRTKNPEESRVHLVHGSPIRSVVMEKAQLKEHNKVGHVASIVENQRGVNAAIIFAFSIFSAWNPNPWDSDPTFPN